MNERTRHFDVFTRTCTLTGEDCTYMGDNGSTDCRRCVVPIVVELHRIGNVTGGGDLP